MTDPTNERDAGLEVDTVSALAEALEPSVPDPHRAAALRARVLAAAAVTPQQPAPGRTAGFEFVTTGERQWETRRLGVEFCLLHEDAHSRAFLLRLRPGGVLPAHIHDMDEESLMLEGDAWVGDVRYITAGDYHFVPAGTPHPDLRSPQGCIVFVRGERRYKPKITPTLLSRLFAGWWRRD